MSRARTKAVVTWVLRVALLFQCVGMFRHAHVDGTAIGEALFELLRWSETSMLIVERGLAWAALLAAVACLVVTSRLLLGFLAGYFLLDACLGWVVGGTFAPALVLPSDAARYLLPLALSWWARDRDDDDRLATWLMRVGIGVTFVGHGTEALLHNPHFVDYIIAAGQRVLSMRIEQAAAETILTAIGIVDVGVGAATLAGRRWRGVFGYMAAWGLLTSLARIVYLGPGKWPAVAIRAAHVGLPVALFLTCARTPDPSSD